MPVIYETTAKIAENGHLLLDIADLPFETGTEFLVKLIPQRPFPPETFKERMQALIVECAKNNPDHGLSKDQILADLRRQREEMYACHE
jgi:hypothetical protein